MYNITGADFAHKLSKLIAKKTFDLASEKERIEVQLNYWEEFYQFFKSFCESHNIDLEKWTIEL